MPLPRLATVRVQDEYKYFLNLLLSLLYFDKYKQ
jgi:hypothetical protein